MKRLPWTYCGNFSKGKFFGDRLCTLYRGILSPIYPENVRFKGYRVISLETDVA